MKKNQKGFTLVELIIAVAILAIVTLAVCGFIVVGSRSYTTANTDIMLQQDAQLALNQISDVIIDTTDSISYGLRSGGSGDMQLVLKDSEFAGEADEKCLVVVNKQEAGSVNDNKSYWFYWSKDDEMIYFNEVDASSDMDEGDIKSAFEDAAKQENVSILAQHVKDFSVDISQFEANRVVMISVLFANGNREYATSNNVTVRNRIALNQITVDPMRRAKEFTINVVPSLTLEPGDFYELADVTSVGGDAEDKALSFEIVGGVLNDTSVTSTGYLTIGKAETRSNFSVKVSRLNEEYAGQNERVARTIRINVKRVTTINIGGPDTAKQGETVELTNSRAAGNLLGVRCDSNLCISDDLSKDDDLHTYISTGDNFGWKIISGNEYAQLSNPTSSSASLKIDQNAPEGSKIVIQASSLLSGTKGYGNTDTPTVPPVTGTKTITVVKGVSDTVAMPGSFRFGEDNDSILSWLKQGITMGSASEYLVYARVKDPSGQMEDRVVLYYTDDGENIRFFPDMFGLVLDRDYKLYLQAILPVHNDVIKDEKIKAPGNSDFSGYVHAYDDVIVDYILNNLDPSSGKYIGKDYDAGFYYEGTISPPFISIECNGITYPNNNKDIFETYSVLSGGGNVIYSINLNPDGVMNIDAGRSLNGDIHFSIYKGDGDDISNWELVAGYDPDTSRTDLSRGHVTQSGSYYFEELGGYLTTSGQSFTNTDMFRLNIQQSGNPLLANNYFQRDTNKSDSTACGTYHIVPCFIYANNPDVRGYNFLYRCFDYDGDDVDFSRHLHVQTSAAIKLEVTPGLNLQLPSENGEERWTDFPLPSDSSFPFVRGADYVQTVIRSFTKYSASAEWKGSLDNIKVDCEYVPATGAQAECYKLWLYTESDRNGASYTRNVIGAYVWKSGEKKWTAYNLVPHTERVTIETNIEYTKDGNTWIAYFPYPGGSKFPFSGTTTQTYSFVAYNKSGNYTTSVENAIVEWNSSSNTIEIRTEARSYHKVDVYKYGKWEYSGGQWVKKEESGKFTNAVWDACIIFWGNRFELPGPGQPGFPSLTQGVVYTDANVAKTVYNSGDLYGEWGGETMYFTLEYLYDGSKYTVTVKHMGWGGLNLGTWTWNASKSDWEQTN